MFYLSIVIIIISSVSYHIVQKYVPSNANPALVLILTYIVAAITSLSLFIFFPLKLPFKQEFQQLRISSLALGFAIVGIEIGWLLAYRAGWNINIGSLLANSSVAIALIPIGLLLFRESFDLQKAIGLLLCTLGLVFLTRA